jgi:hypothetical protein
VNERKSNKGNPEAAESNHKQVAITITSLATTLLVFALTVVGAGNAWARVKALFSRIHIGLSERGGSEHPPSGGISMSGKRLASTAPSKDAHLCAHALGSL